MRKKNCKNIQLLNAYILEGGFMPVNRDVVMNVGQQAALQQAE
jgi:hypothetical protein